MGWVAGLQAPRSASAWTRIEAQASRTGVMSAAHSSIAPSSFFRLAWVRRAVMSVSYTHLTLPTSDLV